MAIKDLTLSPSFPPEAAEIQLATVEDFYGGNLSVEYVRRGSTDAVITIRSGWRTCENRELKQGSSLLIKGPRAYYLIKIQRIYATNPRVAVTTQRLFTGNDMESCY